MPRLNILEYDFKKWFSIFASYNYKINKKLILHDGPPFANGHIHLGHVFNKVFKDILARFFIYIKYSVNYIMGWDCHGVPIERLCKGDKEQCKTLSQHFINIQKREFESINTGSILYPECIYNEYYYTNSNVYLCNVINNFFKLLKFGYISIKSIPLLFDLKHSEIVPYSEIEYKEVICDSYYFLFRTLCNKFIVIWTTTFWTIPSNKCISYSIFIKYVISIDLYNRYLIHSYYFFTVYQDKLNLKFVKNISIDEICQLKYYSITHCIYCLIQDNNICDVSGSGFVHIAPAHGPSDYILGKSFGVDNAIDENGNFTELMPSLYKLNLIQGERTLLKILDNNILLKVSILHKNAYSVRSNQILHYISSKQIMFDVSNIIGAILNDIDNIQWIPLSSKLRFVSILKNRPEYWCISRNRSYGCSIPIYIKNNDIYYTYKYHNTIINNINKYGVDFWSNKNRSLIKVPSRYVVSDYTFDVWFESGSSFNIFKRSPDIVIEGSDQHRGWFQSQMLISYAINKKSPFKFVLTHGYVKDNLNRKMSKSVGNVICVDEILNKVNSDCIRLLLLLSDFTSKDVQISEISISRAGEVYDKINRITSFLLINSLYQHINVVKYDCLNFDILDIYFLYYVKKLINNNILLFKSNIYSIKFFIDTIYHYISKYISCTKHKLKLNEIYIITTKYVYTCMIYELCKIISFILPNMFIEINNSGFCLTKFNINYKCLLYKSYIIKKCNTFMLSMYKSINIVIDNLKKCFIIKSSFDIVIFVKHYTKICEFICNMLLVAYIFQYKVYRDKYKNIPYIYYDKNIIIVKSCNIMGLCVLCNKYIFFNNSCIRCIV